jgi:hypothetical protein
MRNLLLGVALSALLFAALPQSAQQRSNTSRPRAGVTNSAGPNVLPKSDGVNLVGSPISVVGGRVHINAAEVGMPAHSKIGGVAVNGLPDDVLAEGFIQWATGLDPVMRIDAGENNGLEVRSDSGVGITADGRIDLNSAGVRLQPSGIPVYANNAAATAGGLIPGMLYRTGGDPDQLCIVH